MDARYKIAYLADYPDYVASCAAFHFTAWGVKEDERSFWKDLEKFKVSIHKDQIPFTVLMIDTKKNVLVGMTSLWERDSDYWTDVAPWLNSVFVHEDYRGLGLASAMIAETERKAQELGIKTLYLTSSTAVDLYIKLGYTIKDTRIAPETKTGEETLFCKDL